MRRQRHPQRSGTPPVVRGSAGGQVRTFPGAVRRSVDPSALTTAERRVLDELLTGGSTREMARRLFVTDATIRTHLTRIYSKLGVRGRVELLARYVTPDRPPAPISEPLVAACSPMRSIERAAPESRPRVGLITATFSVIGLISMGATLGWIEPYGPPLRGPAILLIGLLFQRWPPARAWSPVAFAPWVGAALSMETIAVTIGLRSI